MKEPYYHIVLDDNEHSAVIQSLNDTRNALLAEENQRTYWTTLLSKSATPLTVKSG